MAKFCENRKNHGIKSLAQRSLYSP